VKKNSAAEIKLKTISMTWEEAKKKARDREIKDGRRLVVKSLCFRGNEER